MRAGLFFIKKKIMNTVLLLVASNVFMTFAWYGHLRFKAAPLYLAVLASWAIAFVGREGIIARRAEMMAHHIAAFIVSSSRTILAAAASASSKWQSKSRHCA